MRPRCSADGQTAKQGNLVKPQHSVRTFHRPHSVRLHTECLLDSCRKQPDLCSQPRLALARHRGECSGGRDGSCFPGWRRFCTIFLLEFCWSGAGGGAGDTDTGIPSQTGRLLVGRGCGTAQLRIKISSRRAAVAI